MIEIITNASSLHDIFIQLEHRECSIYIKFQFERIEENRIKVNLKEGSYYFEDNCVNSF